MTDGSVYYCWACDAHRRTILSASERHICSHCGEALTADSLVSTPCQSVGLGNVLLQLTATRREKSANVASYPAA